MLGTLVLLAALTMPAVVAPQSPAARDEAAIREVVRKYIEARDRRAVAALSALFTDDADQLTSSGEWRKGREALVRGTLASSRSNPGTRTIAIEAIRFPAPGIAIADGRYEIAGASQSGTRRMWTSFVLSSAGGTWRIAAIRNMLPAAAPQPAAQDPSQGIEQLGVQDADRRPRRLAGRDADGAPALTRTPFGPSSGSSASCAGRAATGTCCRFTRIRVQV